MVFAFRYFADDGGPGRYGHHVYDHPVFESAAVIDDLTVELTFAEPVATFTLLPGGDLPILPRHVWEGIEDPRADAVSLPVGTGPYRMTDYNPGVSYRLEANDDYFFGPPVVDTLIMPVVADAQAAFASLRTGELDFVTRNLPAPPWSVRSKKPRTWPSSGAAACGWPTWWPSRWPSPAWRAARG